MRKSDKGAKPVRAKRPRDIAENITDGATLDRAKIHRTNQRAVQAADRLLKEMDDVFRQLERRR